MTDFPHVRLVCCELCGQPTAEDKLRRVELRESGKRANGGFQMARAVRVCDRHDISGPLAPPRGTRAGASRFRPQDESLF